MSEFSFSVSPVPGKVTRRVEHVLVSESTLHQCLGVIVRDFMHSLDPVNLFMNPSSRLSIDGWDMWSDVPVSVHALKVLVAEGEDTDFADTVVIGLIRHFGARLWGCKPSDIKVTTSTGATL